MNELEQSKFAVGYEMGRDAFRRGLTRVPIYDPAVRRYLSAYPGEIGTNLPMLRGWNKGWDEANLHVYILTGIQVAELLATLREAEDITECNCPDGPSKCDGSCTHSGLGRAIKLLEEVLYV